MSTCILNTGAPKRIGFISTRFHGTDGVTLEARKWAQILAGMGHSCFWMAGLLDAPPEISHVAPLAFFNHPEVADVQSTLFGVAFRTRAVTNQIQSIKERLKDELYRFIEKFEVEWGGSVDQHPDFGRQLTFALEQKRRHAIEQRTARKARAVLRERFEVQQLPTDHVGL